MACASTSTIHTQPPGADVFINGQRCGVTPCIHHDRHGFPDRMRVQIRSPGYKSAEFFVFTEPPVASFLLYGFGSYVFHAFAKEYRFTLEPLGTAEPDRASQPSPEIGSVLNEVELANVFEQCLYWSAQDAQDVWTKRFFNNAAVFDCKTAESMLAIPGMQTDVPKPVLARSLIRYVEYRRRMNLAAIKLPWSVEVLCSAAKVEYAKRVGATAVPPSLPAFDQLCPEESKQLRNE